MARPQQEAIDTFVSITGADEQMFFDRVGSAGTPNHDAQGSHPREATVEVKDSNIQTGPSSQASVVGNVTGHGSSYDPEFRETIIIDDDEDELSYGLSSQHANIPSSVSQPNPPLPTASNIQTGPSSQASVVGNVTGHGSSYDPEFRETIIIDDDEDELSYGLSSQHANIPSSVSQPNPPLPTASNIQTGPSNQASVVGNVTGHGSSYGPEFRETIIIDDDEDELSYGLSSQHTNIPSSVSQPNPPLPTASNIQTCPSSQASVVGNVIGHGSSYGPEFRETIIIDDDEDELSYGLSSQHTNIPSSVSQPNPPLPTASNIQTCPSSQASVVGNVIGHGSSYGPEFRETIIIDDDEDELSYGLSSQHTNIPSSVSQPNPPLPTASNIQTCPSSQASVVGNVIGHGSSYGLEFCETIIIDDEEDELSYGLSSQHANIPSSVSQPNPPLPTAPPLVHVTDNDIEEEMIRAAIEASKREAEGLVNTAELERTQYLDGINLGNHSSDEYMETAGGTVGRQELITGRAGTSIQPTDEEETLDVEEEPLVRQCSRRIPSGDTELTQPILPGDSPPSSSQPQNNDHQYNGTDFPSEWGGISFEEHDEAVMLEAAMFGGIPGARTYPLSIPSHGSSSYYPQAVHSPPLELTEQRLLRKQQDDEYLASLQADQEKEMKRLQEAELRQLEETAAKEAALEKQKQDEEERRKKQLENEEIESSLATKQASLPLEPPSDKEGVITLVVRMPDGSRQGRRFLKSDKFQSLFDFLDVGRTCRPGTYRLVRTYPRRAFTSADGDLSFSELGLTSKQEALFIEQINE